MTVRVLPDLCGYDHPDITGDHDPCCGAEHDCYVCTLGPDHKGPHLAGDSISIVLAWEDEPDTNEPDADAYLDSIARVMSGTEWSADTLDTIADIVRLSGRTIEEA